VQKERFSWDDDKAATNLEKHDVDFEEAAKALDDPSKVEWWDEDHSSPSEDRFILIGHSGSRLLVVVYTERGKRKHIISAWKAEKDDRKAYEAQRR
jgi:uncharacterized DUF497 family protein